MKTTYVYLGVEKVAYQFSEEEIMLLKRDLENKFMAIFNPKDGYYMRTGILDEEGKDTGIDPFMASFPELIDVGVMGSCVHGSSGLCIKSGVRCYQNGLNVHKRDMSLEEFKSIVDQCKGKTFQLALGGRGDVDQHANFEEILAYCRDNSIVPNFTTSGLGMTPEIASICKKYCGAVAVSWYRSIYTLKAIEMLVVAGVTTNIHYVLGNSSIVEAIDRLYKNGFPDDINAVIFLLHKPIGLGTQEDVLKVGNKNVNTFFALIDKMNFDFQVGFDSCTAPGIVNFTKNIDLDSIDFCEGARFSCYIDSEMNIMPCSFGNDDDKWFVSLNNSTIKEAWNSQVFENFRNHFKKACPSCKDRLLCGNGCPIVNEITLCERKERI